MPCRAVSCRPAKVSGPDHPDVIVETATLASVVPPDPTYKVHKGIQVSYSSSSSGHEGAAPAARYHSQAGARKRSSGDGLLTCRWCVFGRGRHHVLVRRACMNSCTCCTDTCAADASCDCQASDATYDNPAERSAAFVILIACFSCCLC